MTVVIAVERHSDGDEAVAVIVVSGEVDYSNVAELEAALRDGEAAGGAVRIDLRTLEFIDSRGLGAILQASLRADERGMRFHIVPSPFVERMIAAAGLDARLATVRVPARLEVTYPAVAGSVPVARAAFVDTFPDLPGRVVDDAKVLLTELVTNAIRHGARPEGWVRLIVREVEGMLRIDVTDSGELDGVPAIRPPQRDRVGGWGLQVVDTVATRWGVTTDRDRTVWCELAVDA